MAKRDVENILYDESFKTKICDKIKFKLGCLYFTSVNSGINIFLASLETKYLEFISV